jgi:hypothetical protein
MIRSAGVEAPYLSFALDRMSWAYFRRRGRRDAEVELPILKDGHLVGFMLMFCFYDIGLGGRCGAEVGYSALGLRYRQRIVVIPYLTGKAKIQLVRLMPSVA